MFTLLHPNIFSEICSVATQDGPRAIASVLSCAMLGDVKPSLVHATKRTALLFALRKLATPHHLHKVALNTV